MSYSQLLDYYSDYLIVNQSNCHCTALGSELCISHDKFTRSLHKAELDSSWLWRSSKPLVKRISSPSGILVIDDTIEEKRYSAESDWNCYHWDHCQNRSVKGINQVTALYHSKDLSVPVGFEIVSKPDIVWNEKTGKNKRVSRKSKQELFRGLIKQAVDNQLPIQYIVADKWFSSKENMNYIADLSQNFVLPLKHNRKVALSQQAKAKGEYQAVSQVSLEVGQVRIVYVEGVEFALLLQKQVFQSEDDALTGNEPTLYLVSNDLTLDAPAMTAIYSIRWKVECFFKSIKSNLGYGKSPAHTQKSQVNHLVLTMVAFIKLEIFKDKTRINHFAFKAKVRAVALSAAWNFWQDCKPLINETA